MITALLVVAVLLVVAALACAASQMMTGSVFGMVWGWVTWNQFAGMLAACLNLIVSINND